MNQLSILIDHGQNAFTPGIPLTGTVHWQLDAAPQELKLQLLWFTSGKGSTDVHLVDSRNFSSSQASGTEAFQFTLPDAPYSFSGKYISLHWALELVAQPGSLNQKIEFVLSPSGQEITLPQLEDPPVKISFAQFKRP